MERSIAGLAPQQESGERAMTCDHRFGDRTHAEPHALRNRLRGLHRTAGSAAPRWAARRGGHQPHRRGDRELGAERTYWPTSDPRDGRRESVTVQRLEYEALADDNPGHNSPLEDNSQNIM